MIAGVFAFTACSDDNSPGNQPDGTPLNPTDVPAAVLSAFEEQYPDADNVQWTKKDNYAVATFTKSGDTSGQQSAWFAWDNGTWGMTEYEIPYSLLPDDVRTAFEASEYAASPWRYDREIDVLKRNETETLSKSTSITLPTGFSSRKSLTPNATKITTNSCPRHPKAPSATGCLQTSPMPASLTPTMKMAAPK